MIQWLENLFSARPITPEPWWYHDWITKLVTWTISTSNDKGYVGIAFLYKNEINNQVMVDCNVSIGYSVSHNPNDYNWYYIKFDPNSFRETTCTHMGEYTRLLKELMLDQKIDDWVHGCFEKLVPCI